MTQHNLTYRGMIYAREVVLGYILGIEPVNTQGGRGQKDPRCVLSLKTSLTLKF